MVYPQNGHGHWNRLGTALGDLGNCAYTGQLFNRRWGIVCRVARKNAAGLDGVTNTTQGFFRRFWYQNWGKRIDMYKGERTVDMVGYRVSHLVVLSYFDTHGDTRWLCRCDCGQEVVRRRAGLLRPGATGIKSCGCIKIYPTRTHGLYYTTEYKMLSQAKTRAKAEGLEFNIEIADIVIPEVCPVLGIKLQVNKGKVGYNSPSLDRLDASRGYVKGNVRVISFKANTIKSNATVEELSKVLEDSIKLQGFGVQTGGAS